MAEPVLANHGYPVAEPFELLVRLSSAWSRAPWVRSRVTLAYPMRPPASPDRTDHGIGQKRVPPCARATFVLVRPSRSPSPVPIALGLAPYLPGIERRAVLTMISWARYPLMAPHGFQLATRRGVEHEKWRSPGCSPQQLDSLFAPMERVLRSLRAVSRGHLANPITPLGIPQRRDDHSAQKRDPSFVSATLRLHPPSRAASRQPRGFPPLLFGRVKAEKCCLLRSPPPVPLMRSAPVSSGDSTRAIQHEIAKILDALDSSRSLRGFAAGR